MGVNKDALDFSAFDEHVFPEPGTPLVYDFTAFDENVPQPKKKRALISFPDGSIVEPQGNAQDTEDFEKFPEKSSVGSQDGGLTSTTLTTSKIATEDLQPISYVDEVKPTNIISLTLKKIKADKDSYQAPSVGVSGSTGGAGIHISPVGENLQYSNSLESQLKNNFNLKDKDIESLYNELKDFPSENERADVYKNPDGTQNLNWTDDVLSRMRSQDYPKYLAYINLGKTYLNLRKLDLEAAKEYNYLLAQYKDLEKDNPQKLNSYDRRKIFNQVKDSQNEVISKSDKLSEDQKNILIGYNNKLWAAEAERFINNNEDAKDYLSQNLSSSLAELDVTPTWSNSFTSKKIYEGEDINNFPVSSIEKYIDQSNPFDVRAFEVYKYSRLFNDAVQKSPTIEEAAINYYSSLDPTLAGQREKLKEDGLDLPNELKAEYVGAFLQDPRTKRLAETDPSFKVLYRQAVNSFEINYPEFSVLRINDIISQAREDRGMNNPIINIPTESGTRQLVDDLVAEGKLTEADKIRYMKYTDPKVGVGQSLKRGATGISLAIFPDLVGTSPIKTPGVTENFLTGYQKTISDIVKSGQDLLRYTLPVSDGTLVPSETQRLFATMTESAKTARVHFNKVNEISEATGNLIGFVPPMIFGGEILEGLGFGSKAAHAINAGFMFEGANRDRALTLFPNDPVKRNAFVYLSTAGDMFLTELLPTKYMRQGISKVLKKDVAEITEALANKSITPQIATNTLFNKTISYIPRVAIENAKQAGTMSILFGGYHKTLESLFGANDLTALDNMYETVKEFKHTFLTTPILAILAVKGKGRPESRKVDSKILMELASAPEFYKQKIIDYASKNGESKQVTEQKLRNLNNAANILSDLQKTQGLTPPQKEKFFIYSVAEKALIDEAKNTTDTNLKQKYLKEAKGFSAVKENILNGSDKATEFYTYEPKPTPEEQSEIDKQAEDAVNRSMGKPEITAEELKAQEGVQGGVEQAGRGGTEAGATVLGEEKLPAGEEQPVEKEQLPKAEEKSQELTDAEADIEKRRKEAKDEQGLAVEFIETFEGTNEDGEVQQVQVRTQRNGKKSNWIKKEDGRWVRIQEYPGENESVKLTEGILYDNIKKISEEKPEYKGSIDEKIDKKYDAELKALREKQGELPKAEETKQEVAKEGEPTVTGVEQEEIVRQIKPITDEMANTEREFKNNGFNIDTDYDNEIIVTDKNGEIVDPEDLPDNLRKMAAGYESATSKLGQVSDIAREKALAESRKVTEVTAEEVKPGELPEGEKPAVYTIENVDQISTEGLDKDKASIVKSIKNTVKAVANLAKGAGKNISVTVHTSPSTYAKAVIESGGKRQDSNTRGFYLGKDGSVHINLERAGTDTVPHEVFHFVLDFMKDNNPELVETIYNQLNSFGEGQRFIESNKKRYTGEVTQKKEAITDFIAHVADGSIVINPSNFAKIKKFIIDSLNKIGFDLKTFNIAEVKDAKELVDLAQLISEKFKKGEEITIEDVKSINDPDVINGDVVATAKIPKDIKADKSTDLKFSRDVDKELEREGILDEAKRGKLSNISGQYMTTTMSDKAMVGKAKYKSVLYDKQGGILYPLLMKKLGLNRVWASLAKSKMISLIDNLKVNDDGYSYIGIMSMGKTSHMSNIDAFNFTFDIIENELRNKKSGLTKEVLINEINKAYEKKYKTGKSIASVVGKPKLNTNMSIDQIKKTVLENISQNKKAAFELRRSFLESLLGKAETKSRLKTVPNYNEVAKMMEEPLIADVSNGSVVAYMKVKKADLKVIKTSPSDIGHHNSYEYAIESSSPFEYVLLDNPVHVSEIYPEFINKSGNKVSFEEAKAKYGEEKAKRTHGRNVILSTPAERVPEAPKTKEGEPQWSREEVENDDIVTASVNVAPLYSTKVGSVEQAGEVHNSELYKNYKKRNEELARSFNLEVVSQEDGVGGYEFSNGEAVMEATTVINVKGKFSDIVEYAAMNGALTPEVQDATIAGMYVKKGSEFHNADKVEVKIDNTEAAMKAAKDAGFDKAGFTLVDGEISFFNVFYEKDPKEQAKLTKQFEDNIVTFVNKYEEYGGQIIDKNTFAVRSEYIDNLRRAEILNGIERKGVFGEQDRTGIRDAFATAKERNTRYTAWKYIDKSATAKEYKALRQKQFDLAAEGKSLSDAERNRMSELEKRMSKILSTTFKTPFEVSAYDKAKEEVDQIASDVATLVEGGFKSEFPTKRPSRAAIKTVRWYSSQPNLLGDGARTNVIVNTEADANFLFNELTKRFPSATGRIETTTTELGYPKRLMEIRTSNGKLAEIQVMTPQGYLAKDGVNNFPKDAQEKAQKSLDETRERLGWNIPDGVGHYFYEINRDLNVPKELRDQAAEISKKYYDAFTNPESKLTDAEFREDVSDFKSKVDEADKTKWDEGNDGTSPDTLNKYLEGGELQFSREEEGKGKTRKEIYREKLDDKDINSIRASLRRKAPDSYILEVLDGLQAAKKNPDELIYDDTVAQLYEDGVTLGGIKNALLEDGMFETGKEVDNYFIQMGGQESMGIFKRLAGAKSDIQFSREEEPSGKEEEVNDKIKKLMPESATFNKLSKPANRSKLFQKNGIGYAEYTNTDNGSVDIYVSAFGSNDFIAFIRVYEKGKPTNRFTSKMVRRSDVPGATRGMMTELQNMLPKDHELSEDRNISTDGIRFFASQLDKGYELLKDEQGNPVTTRVAINGQSKVNDLGIPVPGGRFNDLPVKTEEDFQKAKSVISNLLEKLGIKNPNITWGKRGNVGENTILFDLPVLVKKESIPEVEPEPKKVGLSKAEINKQVEDFSMLPPERLAKVTDKELDEAADAAILNGFNVQSLVDRLRKYKGSYFYDPTSKKFVETESVAPANPLEVRILNKYAAALNAEQTSKPSVETLKKYTEVMDAAKKAFSITGATLRQAQTSQIVADNLSNFLVDKEAAQGSPLTEEQLKEQKELYDESQRLLKEVQDQLKVEIEKNILKDAEIARLKSQKTSSRAKSKRTEVEYKQERKSLLEKAKEALLRLRGTKGKGGEELNYSREEELRQDPTTNLMAIAPVIKEMMGEHLGQNVEKLEDIVNLIHEDLKELDNLTGGVSKSQIIEVIAGKHDAPPIRTRNELANKKRLMKREAELLLELADAKKGLEKAKNEKNTQKQVATNTRIEGLKKAINEVKKFNKESQEMDSEIKEDNDQERLTKKYKQLLSAIDRLESQLRNKDYLEEKKELPPLKLDARTRAAMDRYYDLQTKIREERMRDIINRESTGRKVFRKTMDILGIRRLMQTSFDVSVSLRQGAPLLKPGTSRIWLKSFIDQFKSIKSANYNVLMFQIRNSEKFHEMLEDGIVFNDINTPNEDYANSNFIIKLPGVKASQRAADGFLNTARYELYMKFTKNLEDAGYSRQTHPQQFKDAAKFAMNMTGRGNLIKSLEHSDAQAILGNTFFGARLMASRFNLLNPVYYARISPGMRKIVIRDMLSWASTQLAVAYALSKIPGVSVSTNPDDSDFLQVRYKNKVYDITGGMSMYLRTAVRITQPGISYFLDPKYKLAKKQEQAGKSAIKFFRNKLAPNPSYVMDFFLGRQAPGGFNPKDFLKAYPMYIDDVVDAWKDEGAYALATVLLPNVVGIGFGGYGKKGELETDLDELLRYNKDASEIDYSKFKNNNAGGRLITDKEFDKYAEEVDKRVEKGIKELFEKGDTIVGDSGFPEDKKYSEMTPDQVNRSIKSLKERIRNKVREEMFGTDISDEIDERIRKKSQKLINKMNELED